MKLGTPRTSTLCRKCIRNPNVLQGSNLEMVDRDVFDEVPDILETCNLKLGIPRTSTICRKCVRNPNVLQGSNLEMVDRGVFDEVPDILETSNLKLGTPRTPNLCRKCIRTQMSSKDPTWRWWTGTSLMRFLIS